MEITLCFLLAYIAESFIFWIYCDNILLSKNNIFINKFLIILMGYGFMFAFSFSKYVPTNMLSFFFINIILIFVLYDTTIFMSAFHSIILTIMMGMSELICDSALLHISHNFYVSITVNFSSFALYAALSKLLYLMIVLIISLKSSKIKDNPSPTTSGDLLLFLIPLFSAFIMITISFIGYHASFSKHIEWMIAISTFLILIINICVFAFYKYSKERQQQFYELQLQLQKESDTVKLSRVEL